MKDANKKYKKIKINYFYLLFCILNISCIFEYQNETIMYTINKHQQILKDNQIIGYIGGRRFSDRSVKNTFKIVFNDKSIIDLSNYSYYRDVVRDVKNGNVFNYL